MTQNGYLNVHCECGARNHEGHLCFKKNHMSESNKAIRPAYTEDGESVITNTANSTTPDTEWEIVDRYSVETGLLKRFFKLYREGRKTGDPQNYIDYFKAEHYLLIEVGKAITSRDTYWKERVEEIYSHFSCCRECAEGATCKDALAIKDNLK